MQSPFNCIQFSGNKCMPLSEADCTLLLKTNINQVRFMTPRTYETYENNFENVRESSELEF